MQEYNSGWIQHRRQKSRGHSPKSRNIHRSPAYVGPSLVAEQKSNLPSSGRDSTLWLYPKLHQHESTAKVDDQIPATLYFLGRVILIDEVVEVYVDQKKDGEIKHWVVLESRDFDVMDEIFDIELDTKELFPQENLNFRVTLYTDDGPSAAHHSMKVYESG